MMLSRRAVAAGLALSPGLAAAQGRPLRVVASFSVLDDIARQIGGPDVTVHVLVGRNGDAHHYDPKPGDARALRDADLVLVSGFNFEGWLPKLLEASGFRGRQAIAGEGIAPILVGRNGDIPDPHIWQSFGNARTYARNVERALAALRPARAAAFARARTAWEARLDTAFAEARAAVPPGQEGRVLVVPHNSFRYLGREFGLTFRGVRGLSTGGQPSAGDFAKLVDAVREAKGAVVFRENMTEARTVERLAAETGARIGGVLYSDALSEPTGPAPTYLAMLRQNVRVIAAGLRA